MIARNDRAGLSLRISVTDRCQLRCRYCMPSDGVSKCQHEDILRFEEIVRFVGCLQQHFDIRKVRLTGGDPLVRKGIEDLIGMLSELGIPDLAVTTNGQRLGPMAGRLRSAGLHRVNVSFDSLNPDVFRGLTREGDVQKTRDGIDAALSEGLSPVKLNMVVLRGINEQEVGELLSFAIDRGCELRYLELMPIGYATHLFEDAFESSEAVRTRLAAGFRLDALPAEPGAAARRFRVTRLSDGASGVAGFISPCSDPFCGGCERLRLTSDGHLIGCLAREGGLDIRACLAEGDGDALVSAVEQVMQHKRQDGCFAQAVPMVAIGG